MKREENKRNDSLLADAVVSFGGLEGIRTLDPHNANVVRSQLRYKPVYPSIILPKKTVVKGKGGR